jgi:L-ascorbate metabolism protein UlaG (beta-lactamase superfamily)
MQNENVHLRQNVQVEPLFDQWYVWPHLVPPATAARNVAERHLKIMESYIDAPQIHALAAKNPKLLGGPFVDYDRNRVEEIKALRDRTKTARSYLLDLSAALAKLDDMLQQNGKGYSLQTLYKQVPEILQGYIELVYDLNNHPTYRLIEPLLYRSKFFSKEPQSLMLRLTKGDDRPFLLSTPRLESDDAIHLKVPFDDPVVDEIFRLKSKPRPIGAVRDMLVSRAEGAESLNSLLTSESPPSYEPYTGRGVRWRYFGHACVLIETNEISMLFDPVLSYTYESSISRYTYLDLPDRIDYAFITHNHQDHVLFETLLQLRHKIATLVVPRGGGGSLQDPSLKLLLHQCGFQSTIELGEMETLKIKGGTVVGLPFLGEHADLDIRTKLAYLVKSGRHTLLFGADSCNIEPKLYEHVHREVGDVDALFLGMECDGAPLTWLYGPLLTQRIERAMDESRRLSGSNYEQAMAMVDIFNCQSVYVYAMGQEPWLNYVMRIKYTEQSRPIVESNRLLEACRQRGITAERLFGEREILMG